ncbi:RrF2 family transcriptional regulator [Verrucomicrobiota bacterium]
MITREADYAVRVVLYLAQHTEEGAVSTADLAEEMDIPYRFLRKIVRRMVDAELVVSQRGQGGGLRLARSEKEISLADVLNAIDPSGVKLNLCMLEGDGCQRSKFCVVSKKFEVLQAELDEKLRSITFDKF